MRDLLCIIDMQEDFEHNRIAVDHIKNMIRKFKQNEQEIVVLTYGGCGILLKEISLELNECKSNNVHYMDSDMNARAHLLMEHLPRDHYTVVGVDTDYCILWTVFSLLGKNKNVTVLSDCCYTVSGFTRHMDALDMMRKAGAQVTLSNEYIPLCV